MLEILDSRLRIVETSLDMRGKRSDSSSCNMMAKEINRAGQRSTWQD